jgi:hypothetical protein
LHLVITFINKDGVEDDSATLEKQLIKESDINKPGTNIMKEITIRPDEWVKATKRKSKYLRANRIRVVMENSI